MKNAITKLTIATACLAAATGVAAAQTLKAEIPFAFRAGEKVMAPGTYTVRVANPRHTVTVVNYDARQAAVMVTGPEGTAPKEWRAKGEPVLAFECGGNRCVLARVWTADSDRAMEIAHRRLGGNEHIALTLVRLQRANGD